MKTVLPAVLVLIIGSAGAQSVNSLHFTGTLELVDNHQPLRRLSARCDAP